MRIPEHLATQDEAQRRCDRVVDIPSLNGDEAIEELCGSSQTLGPALACTGIEEIAVMVQEWLRRVPAYHVDAEAASRPPSSFQWGWNNIPVEV